VTIAAGFFCMDGIVICADQKHTTGGGSQFNESKLFDVASDTCQFLIALSGHVDYGKMVIDEIRKNLDICTTYDIMERVLAEASRKIFRERIGTVFQARDLGRPQIEAIVCASHCRQQPTERPRLWKLVDAAMPQITDFDCVGSGSDIARYIVKMLFPSMWGPVMTQRVAHVVAQHLTYHAIQYDPDCGGAVEMRGIPFPGSTYEGMPAFVSTPSSREFRELSDSLRTAVLALLDNAIDATETDGRLKRFHAAAMAVKNEDMRISAEMRHNREQAEKASRPSTSRRSKGRQ